MATTITLQSIANTARAYPELTPIMGTGGFTQEPALSIGNDVLQKMLAVGMNWKFNRANAAPFLTNTLQQDYITSITNLSWLELAWRTDINNTATPLPTYQMETVRDLPKTFRQNNSPFQISWLPNALAIYGTWQALTSYPTGLGQAQTPASPIQQFIDSNGNFLYVSTNGTSGAVAPSAPASSAAGVTVADGTVVWKVADPGGVAFRINPLPANAGIVWQINPIYQKKPPILTSLQNTITPIPDEYGYLFRQGFIAMCYGHAGSGKFREAYAIWEEALFNAVRSADREQENNTMYPSESIMGGGNINYAAIGPAWPW